MGRGVSSILTALLAVTLSESAPLLWRVDSGAVAVNLDRKRSSMIRVGIAGIGFMGWIHYLAYQKVRGVKIVAIK